MINVRCEGKILSLAPSEFVGAPNLFTYIIKFLFLIQQYIEHWQLRVMGFV